MDIYQKRQEQKARGDKYREAAVRLFPGVTVRHACAVNESADGDGAFLEVGIWIPRAEIEPPVIDDEPAGVQEHSEVMRAVMGEDEA